MTLCTNVLLFLSSIGLLVQESVTPVFVALHRKNRWTRPDSIFLFLNLTLARQVAHLFVVIIIFSDMVSS